MITSFTGAYHFLSSFHTARFRWAGIQWPGAEYAFQAAKVLDPDDRRAFLLLASPAEAKQAGRSVTPRHDWEQVKKQVMMEIVLAKFSQNPDLRDRLAATGTAVLVEGNTWGDDYWGAVPGRIGEATVLPCWAAGRSDPSYVLYGHNWLGRILMMAREILA